MRPETLLVRATKHPVPMRRTRVKPNKRTGRDDTMLYPDDPPAEWPNDAYTFRAIRRGDLAVVKAKAKPAPAAPKKKEG